MASDILESIKNDAFKSCVTGRNDPAGSACREQIDAINQKNYCCKFKAVIKIMHAKKMATEVDPFAAVSKTLTIQAIASVSNGNMIRKKEGAM